LDTILCIAVGGQFGTKFICIFRVMSVDCKVGTLAQIVTSADFGGFSGES